MFYFGSTFSTWNETKGFSQTETESKTQSESLDPRLETQKSMPRESENGQGFFLEINWPWKRGGWLERGFGRLEGLEKKLLGWRFFREGFLEGEFPTSFFWSCFSSSFVVRRQSPHEMQENIPGSCRICRIPTYALGSVSNLKIVLIITSEHWVLNHLQAKMMESMK